MAKNQLTLAKTHDSCKAKEPKLTVVLIHGIAANSSSYNEALEYLEKEASLSDVRFVAFDLLGAGKSLTSDELQYSYDEQLEALHNSIEELNIKTPLVLVGHSMGSFIATRYADTYKGSVVRLVLISGPIYTEEDLESPAMQFAMNAFRDAIAAKNKEYVKSKAFNNSIDNIVLDKKNFKTLAELTARTVLIHGSHDQLIAEFNYPTILKANPEHLTDIATEGGHSITKDKYTKLAEVLEGVLKENSK